MLYDRVDFGEKVLKEYTKAYILNHVHKLDKNLKRIG